MAIKKSAFCLFVLVLWAPLAAQVNTGNIMGQVVGQDGAALPGVTVILSGSLLAPITISTSTEGKFRFLSLDPAGDYALKAELLGFKTLSRGNIIVTVGRNTEVVLTMEAGVLEEEVTVVAASPIVETKKTTIGANFTRETLQSLPTARDPWVVLQMAPGISVDRENIGGSESGQQSGFFAKGGGMSASWSMEGAAITDLSAGSSPGYYDFDMFEEIQITTGGADITQFTGGVALNLVTRRGGNRVSGGARFFFTDSKFQANNLTDALRDEGVLDVNKIRAIKDYGFNIGGPLVKDKAWWWISWGIQDIWKYNLYGVKDDALLTSFAGKLNVQVFPANRLTLSAWGGNKEMFGRNASYDFPGGFYQNAAKHFGNLHYLVQDEHMFGKSLFLTAKYSASDTGFNLTPMDDLEIAKLAAQDVTTGIWHDSYNYYRAVRPSASAYLEANYFNDALLGASHEFKIGFMWRRSKGVHTDTWPGNVRRYYNFNTLTLDITGDNVADLVPDIQRIDVWRATSSDYRVRQYGAYIQDTIGMGRFNLMLGLRYDNQTSWIAEHTRAAVEMDSPVWQDNFAPAVVSAIDGVLPGLTIPGLKPDNAWAWFLPRIGLTYDLFGDGKTIAKLSFGRYGDFMGTGMAQYWAPTGAGGQMSFYWLDDGDSLVELDELFWRTASDYAPQRVFDDAGDLVGDAAGAYGIMWTGYDLDDPQKLGDPRYTVDWNGTRSTELIFSIERELLPDLAVGLDLSWRKYDHYGWILPYDPATGDIEDKDEYVAVGTIPATAGGISTEDAAGKPYYMYGADVPYRYNRFLGEQKGYYHDYYGLELRIQKRLSKRWMLNGSATLQTTKTHFGETGYTNPQNLWAEDDNIRVWWFGGSSGKVSIPMNSRYMFKLSGLYQLPLDFNVSLNFNARDGHLVRHGLTIVDYDAPNPYNQSVFAMLQPWGEDRLPFFWNFDLRIEKLIKAGDKVRIYLMADVFNVFNNAQVNRRYSKDIGTYYVHNGYFAPNATSGLANEILNPRVARFGIRFTI